MMQSFTKEADELYRLVSEIEIPEENKFACYEAFLEKERACVNKREEWRNPLKTSKNNTSKLRTVDGQYRQVPSFARP